MKRYEPKTIEPKWQQYWDENQTYKADLKSSKQKYIGMSMFNYPSGAGIHIGHAMNYTISDVMARFKRQQGYESYHPIGWDAFGLPAENYAIKAGISPQESMATIIPSYHKQYKAMGWSNDWSKEISTHEPQYYKWTQWIFSQMYRNGLAYQDARQQWWCEKCQTVLANEQIEANGKCWRHDSDDDVEVTKREVKQWFFKITDYADELLEATDALDWTETVKTAQKNWIGKSKGAEVTFKIEDRKSDTGEDCVTVFTTRPDTLYGATFLVLAPEHEMVNMLTIDDKKDEVTAYQKAAAKKDEVERQASKEKTGVFTGSFAINPINGDKLPIWIADYVLVGYGTGAIMAVPAHDERDNEFAKKYDLPIRQVVAKFFPADPGNELKEDAGTEVRHNVVVALKHWQDDAYLCLDWKTKDWKSFVTGGVDDGEDISVAALREIKEETGYEDVEIVEIGQEYHSSFYAPHKEVNRYMKATMVTARLRSDKQTEISAEESADHTPVWVEAGKLLDFVNLSNHKYQAELLKQNELFTDEGVLINSHEYTGISTSDARETIVADLAQRKLAVEKTIFKIRDWSVSRQRYWGAPIPIVNCPSCGPVLLPDDQLPVVLPILDDFAPSGDGRSALARATDWLKVKCPDCGSDAERETDTLDTYICSSWYMLRYTDPYNENEIFSSENANKWMPIDFYNGGDHATAHMIYARFVTRFFHKLGLVGDPEPFKKFLFNGKITASDGQMFSKSKGNGVDPLEIINSGYGADALRTYLMFAAPLDLWIRWDPQGVPGTYRFISRVWNIVQDFVDTEPTDGENDAPLKVINPVIKKVTHDLEEQKYNTAIATLMKCCNDLFTLRTKSGFDDSAAWRWALECLVMLMAPFAPHAAEELWHDLGHEDSVQVDHWPEWEDKYLVGDEITYAVQVNGKLRGEVIVAADADQETVVAAARANEKVASYVTGDPKKVIFVPGKLVSFVV